ncbi:MAG: tyrosine--tRNA ligase [Candidatus Kerfeldbacteria bacterium]
MNKIEKIEELLKRGVDQVIVNKSLTNKLESGKKLRIKLGVDATAPKLHLGHTVVLRKLKQFMELGHQVIFLIGDFTAKIGDPSGKMSARKPITTEEIKKNMKSYKKQVGKVLDLSKVEFKQNSEWHNNMDFAELFELASLFTVNQILERDMFKKRIQQKKPLWIHELLYPILQGYDSVALRSDVELGGTDQTFNMLAAREIQPSYNQAPQDIMTSQLLEGTDGKEKMSKSIGNTIDLDDTAKDMFGKTMSIPDDLIIKYFTLLTDVSLKDIESFTKGMKKGDNPRDYKVKLARELVTIYYSEKEADKAEDEFNKMFKEKENPDSMPEYKIGKEDNYTLLDVVAESGLVNSKSDARRMIEQGAVKFDGMQITDWKEKVRVLDGMVLQVGKRKFVKIVK